MFRRDTGALDDELFKGSKSIKLGNLDYGVLAEEMLIDVMVGEGTIGPKLAVTITQGKTKVTQSWDLHPGRTTGYAHHPVLVTPTFCGDKMTITASVGGTAETRTIVFTCSD